MVSITGSTQITIAPDVFEANRVLVTRTRFLLISGKLQNQDGVVHVKANRFEPLGMSIEPFVEAARTYSC